MKIAVNTRFLIKNKLEGIGRFTLETLRVLVREHPEHEFIFLFDRPYDQSFIFAENVTGLVINPPARHPFLWYLWFEQRIPRVLHKIKPDVFLSPDGYCSLSLNTPTVMVIHDIAFEHFPKQIDWLTNKYYRHFTPKFVARAEKIITVSSFTSSDLSNKYNVEASKVSLACNGCDSSFHPIEEKEKQIVRNKISKGKPYFLYVGAIHPRKNPVGLIQAFELFKSASQSDYVLVFAGRKAWKNETLDNLVKNSPYVNEIIFTGFVGDNLHKIMAASFAFVYPSFFEGFGIPILEAMYCEVPVITSNTSSMPEVGGNAALYANPEEPKEIAALMMKLHKSPELRNNLIAEGQKQRQKFSWEKAARVVYNSIKEAVSMDSK